MRLIDTKAVLATIGKGRTTLYFMIKDGTFPAPIINGKRKRQWRDTDVEAWMIAQ